MLRFKVTPNEVELSHGMTIHERLWICKGFLKVCISMRNTVLIDCTWLGHQWMYLSITWNTVSKTLHKMSTAVHSLIAKKNGCLFCFFLQRKTRLYTINMQCTVYIFNYAAYTFGVVMYGCKLQELLKRTRAINGSMCE